MRYGSTGGEGGKALGRGLSMGRKAGDGREKSKTPGQA